MCDITDNIKGIVDNVLGSPKNDFGYNGGWLEYNCPHCAEENMGTVDNKYNFAVLIDEGELWGHCWKCEYSGKLSKVIKRYGSVNDYNEYRESVISLREAYLYQFGETKFDDDFFDEDVNIQLPKGFRLLNMSSNEITLAKNYIIKRGLNEDIVNKFKIGSVDAYNGRFSNRIVIPSYNAFGDLNYWVARDYTGKNKFKILNPKIDKKSIVFNECFINWYEPITLVEGPFDHIVVPNSIPLLGKCLDTESAVYRALVNKCHSYINIFFDDDAVKNTEKTYILLEEKFPNKVRVIDCPNGYDASDYYREFGTQGIVSLLKQAHSLHEFDVLRNKL